MDIEIPAGLVKIDAEDCLQGYKLVEIDSDEHRAAIAAEKPEKKKKGE
jgi:hypothetical protein